MLVALALISLAFLSTPTTSDNDEHTVRIGLFSLFKPDRLEIDVVDGGSAVVTAGSIQQIPVSSGETIRIRRSGKSISFNVAGAGRSIHYTPATELRIWPTGRTSLVLTIPRKINRTVQGRISVTALKPQQGDWLNIVLESGIEDAVLSAAAAELAGEREMEAIKAIAVAARSFLLSSKDRHRARGYDLCDTTHCQLYKGEVDSASAAVAAAVASTIGEILRFNDQVIPGYYTAACGGRTATPRMVWGGPPSSSYHYVVKACAWCEASRYREWDRSASVHSVLNALRGLSRVPLSESTHIAVQANPMSRLVQRVVIRDRGRRISLSADQFRRRVGQALGWNTILSPSFTVERRAGLFIFRGHGFGSQVGLCVAGALAQAATGRSYRTILEFYYPRTEVVGFMVEEGDK